MRIEYKRTGNVYLNAGIAGIAERLQVLVLQKDYTLTLGYDFEWGWGNNLLWIESHRLIDLLEHLYYEMGKVYYDHPTKNIDGNYFYDLNASSFSPFPRMQTYGFGVLLNNNRVNTSTPHAINLKHASKNDKLEILQIAEKAKLFYRAQGKELGATLYLNQPYTKVPKLEFHEKFLIDGSKICPLTGEGYKYLIDDSATNPTASKLPSFLSNASTSTSKIGWKSAYAMRFSVVLALYRYSRDYRSLYCYFYDHPDLETLYIIYSQIRNIVYLEDDAKQESNHLSNIRLAPLGLGGTKNAQLASSDFVHPNEILFQLIYTLGKALYDLSTDDRGLLKRAEDDKGINLYLLRADKFAGTMRPNTFTAFNHFAYVRRYIEAAQKFGIDWGHVLASLRIHLPGKERDWSKERLPRETLLKKLIVGQSFLEEMKTIFLGGYTLHLSGDGAGYKRWSQLAKLTKFNEFGPMSNHNEAGKTFREKAYKLGTQIGRAIMDSGETGTAARDVAKSGRKYIIDLDKSRTYDDFLEAVKRIQLRYERSVSKELFIELIDDSNFRTAKLLATIGALNVLLNSKLSTRKDSTTPNNA